MKRLITGLLCLYAIINVSAGCSKNGTDTTNQISSSKHEHVFADANCDTPKTCTLCGETEGETMEHTWLSATYDAPMTCSGCGTTQGKSIDYDNCLFKQGMTPCRLPPNGDFGYVDINGNTIIEPQFDIAYGFARNGLARVGTVGLYEVTYGYINTAGDFVIEEKFIEAGDFAKNGLAAVRQVDENGYDAWGYIDKNGKYVISRTFEEAGDFAENGLAAVKFNGKWGYIDETGTFIIEAKFDEAKQFTDEGIAAVVKAGEAMYIDGNGDPTEYDSEEYPFGLKPVRIGARVGYEDLEGNLVIAAKFFEAYPFGKNGIAMVKSSEDSSYISPEDSYGYINIDGEYVFGPAKLRYSPPIYFSDDGYTIISNSDSDGSSSFVTEMILDEHGNQVVEPRRGYFYSHFDDLNKNR